MLFKLSNSKNEVEIALPAYYHFNERLFKIYSPTSCVSCYSKNGSYQISKVKDGPDVVNEVICGGVPVTQEEFLNGYRKAMNYILHEALVEGYGLRDNSEPVKRSSLKDLLHDLKEYFEPRIGSDANYWDVNVRQKGNSAMNLFIRIEEMSAHL